MAKTCWCSSSWVLPNSFFVATSEFHWRRRIQISSFKIVQRVDHHLDLDYGSDKQLCHYYIFGLVFTLRNEGWKQKSEEPDSPSPSSSLLLASPFLRFADSVLRQIHENPTKRPHTAAAAILFLLRDRISDPPRARRNFSHCNKLRKNWNVIWFFLFSFLSERCHKD